MVTPIAINGVICVLITCDLKDQCRIELGFQVWREFLGNRENFSVAQLCRQGGSSLGLEQVSSRNKSEIFGYEVFSHYQGGDSLLLPSKMEYFLTAGLA